MRKQASPNRDTTEDVLELRRQEQFSETLYALATVLWKSSGPRVKAEGLRGSEQELGRNAA